MLISSEQFLAEREQCRIAAQVAEKQAQKLRDLASDKLDELEKAAGGAIVGRCPVAIGCN